MKMNKMSHLKMTIHWNESFYFTSQISYCFSNSRRISASCLHLLLCYHYFVGKWHQTFNLNSSYCILTLRLSLGKVYDFFTSKVLQISKLFSALPPFYNVSNDSVKVLSQHCSPHFLENIRLPIH